MHAFYTLIDQMNAAAPAERPAIEQQIRERFEVERAVFALDMSGFSLTVRREGILAYLGMIRRMQRVTTPIITAHGGELVKHEADNVLALFTDTSAAVRAGLEIQAALAAEQAERPIRVSIGIDHGRFLHVPGRDCFGDAVNTAFKLGEDLADAGEVLITGAARDHLAPELRARVEIDDMALSISGIEIRAARVRAR